MPVPCGKCPHCLRRRLASWSHRLEMESLLWDKQLFVTLTYNNDNVPISNNSFLTLDKRDPTLFFKRLRKMAGKIKYYLVGEYGTNNKRPHYHLILFGTSSLHEDDVLYAWQGRGDVYFGKVESGSIRYCVQYYDKGEWTPSHKRDDRVPEYSTMSEGIGKNFLTERMVKHLLADPSKGYIYDKEGRKIPIPAYYKKRLFDYVGTDSLVANNPSILVHRDEMLEAKKLHHKEIAKVMLDLPAEENTPELHQARKMAIINYRNSKRKTRS